MTTSTRTFRLPKPLLFMGTALSFGLFGLGALFFTLFLFPALFLLIRKKARRQAFARQFVRRTFALFIAFISALKLVRIRVLHPEALTRPGSILAANHPSLIDVVTLLSIVPNATTIVKASLLKNPFTAAPIVACDYATNNTGEWGEQVFATFKTLGEELNNGAIFVIFPEGTRTPSNLPPGQTPKLHRGVAQLSLLTGRPITPVRITASPRWLTKDRGWWHLPEEPMTLTFEPLTPIEPAPFLAENEEPRGNTSQAANDPDLHAYNPSTRHAARALTATLSRCLFQ